MERVLMLRLQVHGCCAEACLNGIPVGRLGNPTGTFCLPVHEYLLAGSNEMSLVIDPQPFNSTKVTKTPKVAEGVVGATLRLLLPRVGQFGSELHARTVAELHWAVADGDVYHVPHTISVNTALPIKFPRWRWLDAPETHISDSVVHLVAAYLQDIAVGMKRGDVDIFMTSCALRLEELALAYQQPLTNITNRLRSRLQLLYATKALNMIIPEEASLVLRPCANQKLIECLGANGQPVLQTLPAADGTCSAWPVRIAVVNGQCHILR